MRCVPTPVIARALCLELAPRTRRTALRGQPRVSATNRIRASFAAESTGGAAILTFNSLPIMPQISFFGARGCTLTAKRTATRLYFDCQKDGPVRFLAKKNGNIHRPGATPLAPFDAADICWSPQGWRRLKNFADPPAATLAEPPPPMRVQEAGGAFTVVAE